MHDFFFPHALGSIALILIAGVLTLRAARAHQRLARTFSDVFRWTRVQRVGGGLSFTLLVLAMLTLPYLFESTRLKSYFDVAVVLTLTAALLWGVADALNRRVLMSKTSVGAVTWTGSVKLVPWEQVRLVTFHDFYGGFFRLHASHQTIFMPVQIEQSLRAIAMLEANVPPSALNAAKHGIAISRAVLER